MTEIKKAVLLIGSPKAKNSSSESLGGYLLERIGEYDILTEILHLYSETRTEAKRIQFLEKVENADIIILAAPLYVDTLPAKVIKALTLIANNKKKLKLNKPEALKEQLFVAIVNCGFPEAEQNKIALKVYEQFALEAGIKYLGGIAVGMGVVVNGKPLKEMGGIVKNLVEGLDQAAEEIVNKKQLSDSVIEKTSKPMIPKKWLYILVGHFCWRFQAFKNGVYTKIKDKPYQSLI
ncbi:MAG: NAD(P)H-dependent oxidoreductase [Halanaerobium sp.]